MDIFVKNFINYTHWANLKNVSYRPFTQAPAPVLTLTPTLVITGEPIDFNRILDIEYKRRFNNRLYFTYSLLGH